MYKKELTEFDKCLLRYKIKEYIELIDLDKFELNTEIKDAVTKDKARFNKDIKDTKIVDSELKTEMKLTIYKNKIRNT